MQNPIRVGVVGYGMAAKVMHLPFITTLKEYQLVSILERNRDDSKEKYPDAKIVRTIDEMVSDPSLDLVVITTPNDTHYSYTEKALMNGKHVVLEKPFTNTSAEAAGLIDISQKSGRILSVFHNRRYVADFLTMKRILGDRLLGTIVEYEGHFDRYRPELRVNAWREDNKPGSGIFYDLGSHLIDQALYFFGIPKTVTADIRLQRANTKIDDYFELWLDYGFTKIILKSSMLVREPGPRYMIHGTVGSFLKYGEDPQEALLKDGFLPNVPHWGEEPESQWGLLHTALDGKEVKEIYPSIAGNFGYYYQNLYKTIALGEPLLERPEHGFNTIRMIELALESSDRKATVECRGLYEVTPFVK
ncbi:MAG: oxidoreductase [Bacteroidetes bacterium]|nr:MAG: oxidoreductase [Bacteroidota bacterium]